MKSFRKILIIIFVALIIVLAILFILRSFFCVKEGQEFSPDPFPDIFKKVRCCWGLTPKIAAIAEDDGSCSYPLCNCYICIKCGDNICGNYENKCNCPADCKNK
ncbi:hypothetical protein KJ841_01935 [Patescibacteria group bacterium]|nr:hypothetical protein [Patescibacteria group bacterium]